MSSVTGKVLHKGAPATGAVVIFHPSGNPSETAPRPTGAVQDDGSFTMETIRTPGVAPGRYGVTIIWPGKPARAARGGLGGGEERGGESDRLQGRYANAEAPKFEVTVKRGQNVLDPFNVE